MTSPAARTPAVDAPDRRAPGQPGWTTTAELNATAIRQRLEYYEGLLARRCPEALPLVRTLRAVVDHHDHDRPEPWCMGLNCDNPAPCPTRSLVENELRPPKETQ